MTVQGELVSAKRHRDSSAEVIARRRYNLRILSALAFLRRRRAECRFQVFHIRKAHALPLASQELRIEAELSNGSAERVEHLARRRAHVDGSSGRKGGHVWFQFSKPIQTESLE